MKILLIDNYDSFTYNLYQTVGEIMGDKGTVSVYRNNNITLAEIKKQKYDRIILSPGPGNPKDRAYFGVCADILTRITTIPILGVCLGMQGIAHYFGGTITKAKVPMHGKTSVITHSGKGLFAKLPQGIEVMRYHSLVVDEKTLPECLEVTAIASFGVLPLAHPMSARASLASSNALRAHRSPSLASPQIEIMGLRHKSLPIVGVQFHPESFATEGGKQLLTNFLLLHL